MAVTGGPFSARLAGFYRRAIRYGLPSLDRADLCLADLSASLQSERRRGAGLALTGGPLFSTHLEFCRLLHRTRPKRVADGRLLGIDDSMADVGRWDTQSPTAVCRGPLLWCNPACEIAARSNRRGRRDCRSVAFAH